MDKKVQKLEAKIKESSRYGILQFFSRREYVKFEWRPVPDGFEGQALANDLLDTRPVNAEAEIEEIKETPAAVAAIASVDMSQATDEDQEIESILDGLKDANEESEEKQPTRSRSKKK